MQVSEVWCEAQVTSDQNQSIQMHWKLFTASWSSSYFKKANVATAKPELKSIVNKHIGNNRK